LIGILLALVAGSLLTGLGASGFMTSDEVIAQRTPGLAAVNGFFKALTNEDAAAAGSFLDPDFAILHLPDPFGWEFSFQVTFDRHFEPAQAAEDITHHLSVLAALKPRASVGNCGSHVPRTPLGRELYDHLVACRLLWDDELREKLDAPPVILSIDVGVRNGLIRGFFVTSSDQADPVRAASEPVRGMFLPWLSQQHPAASSQLLALTPWGEPRGIRDPAAVRELLTFAEAFAAWWEELETTGTAPPQPGPPGRVRHSMVYEATANQVLLIGGTAGSTQPRNDVWGFDVKTRTWRAIVPVDLSPETAVLAAVRHPQTDQILAISQDFFTGEATA
jgi:hypothetical protein